jgi:outer membrane protein insertion porin family
VSRCLHRPFALRLVGLCVALGWAGFARAEGESVITPVPELRDSDSDAAALIGKPISRIDVTYLGQRWRRTSTVSRVSLGEPYTGDAARRAMRELLDTGLYASATVSAEPDSRGGVLLTLRVEPRRIVRNVTLVGSPIASDSVLEAANLHAELEVAELQLPELSKKIAQILSVHGFPKAKVEFDATDTDNPKETNLTFRVEPGPPALINQRVFRVTPEPDAPGLPQALNGYALQTGDRADSELLDRADRDLEHELRHLGWHRASVSHVLRHAGTATQLDVLVRAGAFVAIAFEGQRTFDANQLLAALELDANEDLSPRGLTDRIKNHYVKRGFLDAHVGYRIDGAGTPNERLVFLIREQDRVRIVGREYPCLTGPRTPADIGGEIDSFLSEDLPGADILGPVDPRRVDSALGPKAATGARPVPADINPWTTYEANVYERATKHVQDLYRSEGYLSATVGPTQVLRRRCDPHTMPGTCEPIGDRRRPKTLCAYDDIGLPLEEPPPDPKLGCVANPARAITCEPTAILHVPIKLGPRTFIWDVAFEGNARVTDTELVDASLLKLGSPASFAEIDQIRRRIVDTYYERGFAFAEVSTGLDSSPDRTRAKLRLSVREGEQVRVSSIYIRGANLTRESLIRSRIALKVGEPYRTSEVRATEERLATLGVFSSVQVGFEDPYVPAKEKIVVVDLVERDPQYIESRTGVSTGEGLRFALEYGNVNIAHRAIQLSARVQLGYLPNWFILEKDVRTHYENDPLLNTFFGRLTRRDSLAVTFPDIGLGPLFRLRVEGLDVVSNSRDFQLQKQANVDTVSFVPSRRFTVDVGGSLERNKVCIFGTDCQDYHSLSDYVSSNPRLSNAFRIPAGTSVAITQKVGINWDRRNVPLDATSGTLVNLTIEHVTAFPVGTTIEAVTTSAGTVENPFRATHSEFLRPTSRVAGYLPFGRGGFALALSFRWGLNLQLRRDSHTYPDRLFFGGGVDTLRGFLQDSLVPEDVAQRILNRSINFSDVTIRGGDFFVNPRAEFRIPVSQSLQTALFLDAGNVWTRPPPSLTIYNNYTSGSTNTGAHTTTINYARLRYAVGTGLRLVTPIGPLVFDYGFNVERVLDALNLTPAATRRWWEDLGAFHFSIGLF